MAAEIVHRREGRIGLAERFPWIVAFAFGLLHGFGFASALSEVGLPQSAIPVALLFFNVGVEIGQLFFIASIFAVIALARHALASACRNPRGHGGFRPMPLGAFRRSGSSSKSLFFEAARL